MSDKPEEQENKDKDKEAKPEDRSLDYLIYDGMGQVNEDGKIIGSVRP